ncbi:unnamed protein product [Adineta ricciae]|uniref:G-protein coupled receptors family 1 profile domain-containing protein n=1 Tax=Adineta ricciae TaxID=249248 RepID=A0A815MIH0_ADIRI|nr:unnamed protein product [Adineta ricciae]CAF1418765.1 unnamed protein product [Adineta ricciae]
MSLTYVSQQISLYSGIVYLIFGVTGNTINIYVFSSVSAYRRTPTTFYFLSESIFKNIYLLTNLVPRIITFSYGYDFTNVSSLWCKFRQAILMMSGATTLSLTTLSIIDQYLVTSSNPSVRRMSRIQVSHRILLIIVIICSLHAVSFFVYFDISSITKTCISLNSTLSNYMPIYFIVIACIIPISIMSLFGYLTYRNIRQTIALVEQHADRQLIKMTFLQVMLAFIDTAPLGSLYIYNMITSGMIKDQDRLMKEYFAYVIISTEITLYFASSFYVFLFSSSRFRRNVKERLFGKRQTNVILPNTQTK